MQRGFGGKSYQMTDTNQLLPLIIGTTKKELAIRLDKKSPLFNYSVEFGPTSYNNYTRRELVEHCIKFGVDIIPESQKMARTIAWQKKYAEVTATPFMNYNHFISQ